MKRLFDLGKLTDLAISIYGYDAETFVDITQSTEKVYRRLVYNLETFLGQLHRRKFSRANLAAPRRRVAAWRISEITRMLDRIRKAGITVKVSKGVYNNWGGYVTNDDVRGLPIDIVGPDLIYKNGACVRLFTTVQVMATGIVNGCACRDVDATLRLGDFNEMPLRDIISSRNPRLHGIDRSSSSRAISARSARAATCMRASITRARAIEKAASNWRRWTNSSAASREFVPPRPAHISRLEPPPPNIHVPGAGDRPHASNDPYCYEIINRRKRPHVDVQGILPVFEIGLNALSACSTRRRHLRAAKKIEPAVLLQTRLAPDMFPLVRQVQIACDQAKNGVGTPGRRRCARASRTTRRRSNSSRSASPRRSPM